MKSKIIIIGLLILLAIPCSAYALETINIPSPEEAQLELISVSGIPDDLVVRLVLKDNIIAEIHGNTIINSAEFNAKEKLSVKIRFVGKGNLSSAQFNFIEMFPQPTTAYKSKPKNEEIPDENDESAEDPKEENMEDENTEDGNVEDGNMEDENMVGENTEEENPDEDNEDDIEDNDINSIEETNDDGNNDGSSNDGNSNDGNSNNGNCNDGSSNDGNSNDEKSKDINNSMGNEEVKGGQ